jgi:hypothetical protein
MARGATHASGPWVTSWLSLRDVVQESGVPSYDSNSFHAYSTQKNFIYNFKNPGHGLLSGTMRDASTCYEKNVHGKHPAARGGNSRLSDVRVVYPIVPIIVTCDLHLHKLMIDGL